MENLFKQVKINVSAISILKSCSRGNVFEHVLCPGRTLKRSAIQCSPLSSLARHDIRTGRSGNNVFNIR
jgi:hypothetical protein